MQHSVSFKVVVGRKDGAAMTLDDSQGAAGHIAEALQDYAHLKVIIIQEPGEPLVEVSW